jgi:hypothetical protein
MKVFKYIKLIFKFFILGLIIIFGAIILNLLAELMGLYTWYDLFINTEEAINSVGLMDVIFIFIIYPIFLGILASVFNYIFKNKAKA